MQDPRPAGPQDPRLGGPPDMRQGPPEDRSKPGLAPKPMDERRGMYDQNRGYPGSSYQQDPQRHDYPSSSQPGAYHPSPQASQPSTSQSAQFTSPPQGGHYSATGPGLTPTSQGPPSSLPQSPYGQVQKSYKPSTSRLEGMEGKQGSPDLPPPPSSDMPPDLPPPPPPEEQRGFGEENQMPPPPLPGAP